MPIINGLDRQQIRFSSLEDAISADNEVCFVDTLSSKIVLHRQILSLY